MSEPSIRAGGPTPDVSFIMPCYNEEAVAGETIGQLLDAFARAGHALELVVVDNGSHDRTGEILRAIAAREANVRFHRVEVNEGYGKGVLEAIPLCTAPWVGIVVADGQVDAADVVKLYETALRTRPSKLVKVRRRFRMDGLKRKVVSVIYNALTNALFGGLGSTDVNGSPKIIPREYLDRMGLQSKDWFLDAEMLIKAKRLGLGVFEVNVLAQLRPGGTSNVRASTCWEFIRNLVRFRLGLAGRLPRTGEPRAGSAGAACPER